MSFPSYKSQIKQSSKYFFAFLVLLLLLPCLCSAADWQQIKGDHFIVNFLQDKDFANDVLSRAEMYYNKIANDLGYQRYATFWSWNQRVNIFVYPDHESYTKATGQPEWSDGKADYDFKNKQISMYTGSQKFLETILPHEIAHLIFRDFIGFKGTIPLWIDEGIATSAEEPTYADMKKRIKDLYRRSALLKLDDMMTLNFKKVSNQTSVHDILMRDNSPGYLIIAPDKFVALFYIESASIVSFLREHYGPQRFTQFCSDLRDGKSVDQALQDVYQDECPNTKELEKKWRQDIVENMA